MDRFLHSHREQPDAGNDAESTSEDASGLVPVPEEERQPPPLDVDERESAPGPSAPIAMPAHDDDRDDPFDIEGSIDAHQPLPTDNAYHDDDAAAPDPYDIDDPLDMTLPRPVSDRPEAADDFSTGEELDVDTEPDDRTASASTSSSLSDADRHGTPVYIGGPSDDEPVNSESDFYPLSFDDDAGAANTGGDEPERDSGDDAWIDAGPDPQAERASNALPPAGTTTCPVCGRETDALRFCGFCGAQLTEVRRETTATSLTGRLQERASMLLEPVAQWTRPGAVRFIMAVGGILVLLALLANNGAMALMFGAAILPLILVFWCLNLDVFENESPITIAGFGLGGILLGAVLGWLGALVVSNSWFDTGILNFGAAGFGGKYAEAAGSSPFVVWTLVGIVIPLAALAVIIGGPLAMRQTFSLRNEVMDGLTLGAVVGAGFSLGTAIVFASPMLTQGGPVADASTWTLTTIGLTIIRPLIWTLSGGMLGAAAWRYLLSGRIGSALIPAIVGAAAPLLFTLMSIQVSATGLWPEIIWGLLVAVVVGFFYRRTIAQAIEEDRKVLGNDDSRIICPNCNQVTPAGQFCANCGATLPATETTAA